MSHASREEVKVLRKELLSADVALFTALGHYFAGVAQIQQAELEEAEYNKPESEGLKKAARSFRQALKYVNTVREFEERALKLAQPINYSAYFVRRHEVLSADTEALRQGLEEMVKDLSEGYYPAAACGALNPTLARIMTNIDLNARVEGVVSRIDQSDQSGSKRNSNRHTAARSSRQGK